MMRRAMRWTLGCALIAAAPADARAKERKPSPPSGPAAPAIAPGARTFVALAGRPAPVRLAWPAAPNVARYRARWIQAGALVDVELPGTATAFEREVSAAGRHQLAVVAIDAAGRESPPVELAIEVVEVAAIAPGDDEPRSPGAPAFAIGARFRSPGLACRLGDGPAGAEATARTAGAATLRCGGEAGQPRVEVPVVIAPVIVDGPERPIPRGAATTVHVTVASVAPLGARLDVEAAGELDLGAVRRTAHGLDVAVTPRAGARTAALVVRGRGTVLGRVELALADAAPPAPPAPGRLALELGAHLGAFVPPGGGSPAVFGAPGEALTTGPLLGARLGLFPTRRVGLEGELALGAPDYAGGGRELLLAARAHLAARLLDGGRYGLQLVGGAGVLDTAGAVHYGGAFTVETRRNLWLRFQALHAITTAHDAGYAHCLELQLGVVTRLGRRDRR
jgi:hypothetical protein